MIDTDSLERVHEILRKRMYRHERWEAMRPLKDAISSRSSSLLSKGPVSDMLADAEAKTRRATVNLEESEKTHDLRVKEGEDQRQADLALLRRRTELLRHWLEMLS